MNTISSRGWGIFPRNFVPREWHLTFFYVKMSNPPLPPPTFGVNIDRCIITRINDLPDCLEKSTPCLYADDSQIFSSAKDCVERNANLNHDLNNVSQWLVKNKLQHHSTKTKLMYVGSNHNLKIDNEFPVMINDQLIPRVHSIPCLGVKLDETLNWDEHIEMVSKKVGAGIGILKRIKPYVPANTLISIYNALIQPYTSITALPFGEFVTKHYEIIYKSSKIGLPE
jgi:hypothetical protein